MAAKYYTLPELKELALDSANQIPVTTAFTFSDVETSYNSAVAYCGFENPTSADTDYSKKQRFILQAMELYFLNIVLKQNLLKFDVGDLKLSQATREIRRMFEGLEMSLERATKDPETARLFKDASLYFGKMVYNNGILDDAIGVSINPKDV